MSGQPHPRDGAGTLRAGDAQYLTPTQAALHLEPARAAIWSIYLMLAALVVAITWAAFAPVDIITRADARVIPEGREQVIASLEGGILHEMKVREGETVQVGQALALLDPTRVEAQQGESRAKRLSLTAQVARLQAEAGGRPLVFPPELKQAPGVVQAETDSFNARQRALGDAAASNTRNQRLLERELAVSEAMSAKGLVSEVEVMRLRRQVNDLAMQNAERSNRFRQEASAELVKVQNELTLLEEQQVVRDDMLRRTTLSSPVRGIVKNIRVNTLGGVIAAGAPVMEIVPLAADVLVELRIKPADIGFVKIGQKVEIKLTAYDYTIYGMLHGKVQTLSPDAIGDANASPAGAEATWYRALVRADASTLGAGKKSLAVLPGMVGTAEIRNGQRSVLQYLLRPMFKAQEAFTER